jgi:serine/threonine protein phosphatase PrpC
MRLSTYKLTRRGGRRTNEDALKELIRPEYSLLAVADGLGGHGGGALAASLCVETVVSVFSRRPDLSDDALQALVDEADRAIAMLRVERRLPAGSMRTTLALLVACDDKARWAHVGDSRIYWFRERVLMQRTRDHSVFEFMVGRQAGLPLAPPDQADRHRLLRAVGSGQGCRADLGGTDVTLQVGDAFLLCTDGVWGLVSDQEITDCLSNASTPLDWCVALEQRLNRHSKGEMDQEQDNYSIITANVVS